MVAAVSEVTLKTAEVVAPMVTRSPTLSSVWNFVPTPVSADEPEVVDTVPVGGNDGFAGTVSSPLFGFLYE